MKIIKNTGEDRVRWKVGVEFTSGSKEDVYKYSSRNKLNLYFYWFVYTIVFKKQWIKPVIEHHKTNNDFRYKIELERRYGFFYSWLDQIHAFEILYGVDGEHSLKRIKSKKWYKFIPWMEKAHTYRHLLHRNGLFAADITNVDYEETKKLIAAEKFILKDYDGQEITALCWKEQRRWDRGVGWFTWLKYLYEPNIYTYMEIEFDPEYGRGKHEWKGGTIGHSIELDHYAEPMERAMKRYCKENELEYIEEYRKDSTAANITKAKEILDKRKGLEND